MKVTIEFEDRSDVVRMMVMIQNIHADLAEHEYWYGGYDQLYEDMALLDSVRSQLRDKLEESE